MHVAWRAAGLHDDPVAELRRVLTAVLARSSSSASGNSYWAGGATLGPIIAFAYRAAAAAHAEQPTSTLVPAS
jgi:hypothetical protein